jgi:acetamidase/formamidase
VFDGVPATARGPGGHILTGPIAVEGAEPGDTLEVRIHKIDLAIPYAYNAFGVGTGFLTDDFPYSRIRIIPLDRQRMVATFTSDIEIPLHPFFGSMGVAPPPAYGRYDSAPPNINTKQAMTTIARLQPPCCRRRWITAARNARRSCERCDVG